MKSGGKLGIWIPKSSGIPNMPRSTVRITVRNQLGKASFMALAPGWATIPSRIRHDLGIVYDQSLSVLEVKSLKPHRRKPFHIEDGKVDMLSLIPPTSIQGYAMYADQFEIGAEPWLRVWYYHPRGAARQITVKRYMDVSKLGQLLGQLQAEGDKKNTRVVFKNASISEHADFVSALRELGLQAQHILARCIFNPARLTLGAVSEYVHQYRDATGITITQTSAMRAMKGAVAADTFVRSSTLARIPLFAMSGVRRGEFRNELLRRNFLAKLLSGDGSLGPRRTAKRLDVRLTIVDQDVEALRDYAEILLEEGFKPRVFTDRITVRAYCTFLNLLRLYEIGAFRNGKNWVKLLCAIKIQMLGRENRGYKRIQELSSSDEITSGDISAKYRIDRRSSNLWIHTMQRKGMMRNISTIGVGGYKTYAISDKGKRICEILGALERDYHEVCIQRGFRDPEAILQQIKRKANSSLAKKSVLKCPIQQFLAK